jgi:hypothetical protein
MWKCFLVNYSLFWSEINETSIFSIRFRKELKYQISSKSVQWEPSCSTQTDGRTDILLTFGLWCVVVWCKLTDVLGEPTVFIFFCAEDCTTVFLPEGLNRAVCGSSAGGDKCLMSHLSMNRYRSLCAGCCCRPSAEAAVSPSSHRWSRSKLWPVTALQPLGTERTRSVKSSGFRNVVCVYRVVLLDNGRSSVC